MLKGKKGITLIALIITIIIMLILVGVTVSVAIQGGLFSTAKKATTSTETERDSEIKASEGRFQVDGVWYDNLDAYLANTPSKDQPLLSYEEAKKNKDTGVLETNAIFTEENQTAVIPKGFKIVNGMEGTQSIEQGLVIQDAEGNEFVWIPVDYEPTGNVDENGLDEGFKKVFYRSTWKDNARDEDLTLSKEWIEPYDRGYIGENDEYYKMMRSVQTNRGFYIGRYEAGSVDENGEPKVRTDRSRTTKVVVKRDQYPYNYVGWGKDSTDIESDISNCGKGAVHLSNNMYNEADNVGVTSTLCYDVQWDAMLDFVKDGTHDVTNSTSWGNCYDSASAINRETAKYSTDYGKTWKDITSEGANKQIKECYLLTTGANDDFAAKNIYDIAGNEREWTFGTYIKIGSSSCRVLRGSNCIDGGYDSPASYRSGKDPSSSLVYYSFRPALYVNN